MQADQTACAVCGGKQRLIKAGLEETIHLRASLHVGHKRPGIKKFLKQIWSGWFPSKDVARHPDGVQMTRVMDYENRSSAGSYLETVVDQRTGLVTRDVTEKLVDHVSEQDKRGKRS